MADRKYAIVVASPRARTGKTLVARLIADRFLLAGKQPSLFDTDVSERRLAASFPERSSVIDLDRVPDQMRMFDNLIEPQPDVHIVDVTHRSFQKFFAQLRDIEFIEEARGRNVEPVIFYIPGRDAESYEHARSLHEHFHRASLVMVDNAAFGEAGRDIRRHSAYTVMKSHGLRLPLRTLDPFFAGAIDDPALSLSDFVRRSEAKERPAPGPASRLSFAYLSLEARSAIALWLKEAFWEVDRVFREIDHRFAAPTDRVSVW